MTLEWLNRRERASLADSERALVAIIDRIHALSGAETWAERDFVELMTLFNSASYIFLYIESNAAEINPDRLLPLRKTLYDDPELDARLVQRTRALQCTAPDLEDSRRRFADHFDRKAGAGASAAQDVETSLAEARTILLEMEIAQSALLARLHVPASSLRPAAQFYKLVEGADSARIRIRLNRAWEQVAAPHLRALEACADEMIARRRARAMKMGGSVLDDTFSRCGIPHDQAAAFVARFLALASADHVQLRDEIAAECGVASSPLDHFPAFVARRRGQQRTPMFQLERCLDFIFEVAKTVFGIGIHRIDDDGGSRLVAEVRRGTALSGHIVFDLWDVGPVRRNVNQTRGLRNRTDWRDLVQLPIAYVSCKFQRAGDDGERIGFQNLHSLFHEFGHALNHILIRKRFPNQSGLEYLPVERLEHLSMWFERWVFHPALAEHIGLSEEERRGLASCRTIKALEYRRTHLDRAVIAALDMEVHGSPGGSLRDAFAALDARAGVSAWTRLEDYIPYFFWPMLTANPGGYFGYLWSASFAAESFAAFAPGLDRVPRCRMDSGPFAGCFDYDAPCTPPDPQAGFDFYRELAAT